MLIISASQVEDVCDEQPMLTRKEQCAHRLRSLWLVGQLADLRERLSELARVLGPQRSQILVDVDLLDVAKLSAPTAVRRRFAARPRRFQVGGDVLIGAQLARSELADGLAGTRHAC